MKDQPSIFTKLRVYVWALSAVATLSQPYHADAMLAPQEVTSVSLCEALKAPASFQGKHIRVTGIESPAVGTLWFSRLSGDPCPNPYIYMIYADSVLSDRDSQSALNERTRLAQEIANDKEDGSLVKADGSLLVIKGNPFRGSIVVTVVGRMEWKLSREFIGDDTPDELGGVEGGREDTFFPVFVVERLEAAQKYRPSSEAPVRDTRNWPPN